MTAQNVPSEEQPALTDEVMESLGEPQESVNEDSESSESTGAAQPSMHDNDPLYVQKRLKQQRRQHERELRELRARMEDMQQQMVQSPGFQSNQDGAPFQGQAGASVDPIQQAVQMALNARDMQEKRQRDAEAAQHLQKQQRELYRHLDSMNDKYDDFHDTVMSDDVNITPTMRDYAMTLPKKGNGAAGEVLYHLAKNPEELNRISKLHPIDQAAEMARLSHALISGGDSKVSQQRAPMGQVKSAPVSNSHIITDKTPVGNIRQKMKAGTWK